MVLRLRHCGSSSEPGLEMGFKANVGRKRIFEVIQSPMLCLLLLVSVTAENWKTDGMFTYSSVILVVELIFILLIFFDI